MSTETLLPAGPAAEAEPSDAPERPHCSPARRAEDERRRLTREQFQRVLAGKYEPRKPKPDFKPAHPLAHGWLLPYLLRLDDMFWGRWDYWTQAAAEGRLPADPIPRIEWQGEGSHAIRRSARFLEHALEQLTRGQHWHSWGTWTNFEYLLDWMLFGFGHPGHTEPPAEPSDCKGASDRLYQCLDLGPLILHPADYFGEILAANHHGRHVGFFPTPLCLCELIARMQYDFAGDCRTTSVCDPCVGTGRMLLAASNWSMNLFGQDINPVVIKVTLVNGYLYAPWLVRPLSFLGKETAAYSDPRYDRQLSDHMVAAAQGDANASAYADWFQTEHDPDLQPAVHPLKIRRPRKPAPSPESSLSTDRQSELILL